MKIKNISSNQTEIHKNNGDVVLVSYETPVAANTSDGFIKTKMHHSSTTSRHINKWLNGRNAKLVDQEVLDSML